MGDIPRPEIVMPAGESSESEVLVVFTSGTTDEPKAVVHTDRSLTAAFRALSDRAFFTPESVVYTDQAMIGLPALVHGARWNIPRHPFARTLSAEKFARSIRDATHTFVVPAHLPKVLETWEKRRSTRPTRLKQILLGGAPVTAGHIRLIQATVPDVDVLAVYGTTEILPLATTSGAEKLAYAGHGDLLGEPVPGVTVRVEDDGELIYGGPNLCHGYVGAPPMVEMRSGDTGFLVDGRIVLTGRKKDMFIRGETNIYPGLYEPRIVALPGVRDCAFVGHSDVYGDERVTLALVTDDEASFEEAARAVDRIVDRKALPDDVVRIPRIPTSGRSSKPDRAKLAEYLASGAHS